MSGEEDYVSESDEDYCAPEGAAESESSDESDTCSEEPFEEPDLKRNKIENISGHKTRSSKAIQRNIKTKQIDELPSEEETNKSHSDALWADFLSDVTPKDTKQSTKNADLAQDESKDQASRQGQNKTGYKKEPVVLQKDRQDPRRLSSISKRSSSGCGVNSLLNQLGKKKKLSVLEKSQLDWNTFKSDEGIDEELRTHNKGKDGYLERQDFLQRTDLRQFEIEKTLRQSHRNN
ncbi:hypothetical protein KR018_004059 [Drosophila ironensis]|nr:hypothetical protein KR018_004059 [Drosophila ironensis]